MKLFFILTFLLSSINCFSQKIKIDRNAKFDTLYLALKINNSVPEYFKSALTSRTEEIVSKFNKEEKKFVIRIDSNHSSQTLKIEIDSIHIVTQKQQIPAFLGSIVGIIGLPVFFVSVESPIIIAVWFNPRNKVFSRTNLSLDIRGKYYSQPKPHLFFNGGGWFRGTDKNKRRTVRIYGKVLSRLLNGMDWALKK